VRHLRRLRSGWETLCLARKNRGYSTDGGFGEYATAYARYAAQLPPGVDPFDAAPLTCAAVTTYKAVEVSGTRSSDLVTDFGVGGLGHFAIQFAGIAGGRVVAVDLVDEKLEPAKELGAEFHRPRRPGGSLGGDPEAAAPIRRSPSRRGRSSRPTVPSGGAVRSCASRSRPTTRSRSRRR
jgi:NADPH:quinone reductase-like Zn-dependent oxidoreductase